MNKPRLPRCKHDTTSPSPGQDDPSHRDQQSTKWLTKCMLGVTILLSVLLLCAVVLRVSVRMVSDQHNERLSIDINQVSHSDRQQEYTRIREEARREDRELLDQRRNRLWREASRKRPGKFEAYQRWHREVQEIEAQLAEAEFIQSQLTPEQATEGPLAEGTVLWHRKQRLRELRADMPQL